MSINNISSSGLSGKSVQGAIKPEEFAEARSSSKSDTVTTQRSGADKVEISSKEFSSSIEFAKNVLRSDHIKQTDKFQQIQKKIESGHFNSETVINRLSSRITGELRSLEATNFTQKNSPTVESKSEQISGEEMKRLANDPEVRTEIIDRIKRNLDNI